MQNTPELMNLFWSTAGIYPGTADISPYDFEARVKSAAKAGFVGIGIWHTDLEHFCVHYSLKEMRAILDDNGIRYVELEFLTDWFVAGARRKAESDSRKRRLFEASAVLAAKHIKVGDFYNTPCPMSQAVDSFAALCKEAEGYGAKIGFEFMSVSMLNTLDQAVEMVTSAGASNGGLILDIVHVINQGASFADVSRLERRYLIGVELNDGTLPGSARHDPSRARRFCGEGEFDIQGFIAAVKATGYGGPWGVEVFSRELVGLPLDELNSRAYRTTAALLVK